MVSTRWTVRFASTLALVGGTTLLGCAASSPPPTTARGSVDDRFVDLHQQHPHEGDVAMFIALSLRSLGLPPDQRAVVSRIQADLFAKTEPARTGEQTVLTALAEGVAAGGIDKARVDAALKQLESATVPIRVATADALNQLHAALTPRQRIALADDIQAHWAVFRTEDGESDKVGTGDDNRDPRLTKLAGQIGLSTDQVNKIAVAFSAMMDVPQGATDPAEIDARLHRLTAFRSDAFDARSLEGGASTNEHVAARAATLTARFYEAVDPVLTPEQRPKVVALLRDHATRDAAAASVTVAAQ
jgi:Spy/CpxP family protein refolding chaperone